MWCKMVMLCTSDSMFDRKYIFAGILAISFIACQQKQNISESIERSRSVNVSELLQLAWEIRPYSFFFAESAEGESSGVMLGGIKSLVLYSNFTKAVHMSQYANELSYLKFGDLSPLAKLAGVPVFLNRPDSLGIIVHSNKDFVHYNPVWVEWATSNLIPSPEDRIGGLIAQTWYDQSFKRFFHLMVESHQLLVQEQLWKYEKIQYLESLKSEDFDALRYFDERFSDELKDYQYPYSHEVMTGPVAISFWLRRDMDGSREAIWNGLSTFMNQFDKAWFQEHTSQ